MRLQYPEWLPQARAKIEFPWKPAAQPNFFKGKTAPKPKGKLASWCEVGEQIQGWSGGAEAFDLKDLACPAAVRSHSGSSLFWLA